MVFGLSSPMKKSSAKVTPCPVVLGTMTVASDMSSAILNASQLAECINNARKQGIHEIDGAVCYVNHDDVAKAMQASCRGVVGGGVNSRTTGGVPRKVLAAVHEGKNGVAA